MTSVYGEPTPVVLDGKSYLFDPLQNRDIAALDAWVRTRRLQMVRASFTEDMSDQDKALELRVAQDAAANLHFLSREGIRLVSSHEGMAHLTWMMLHQSHPEITMERALELMKDADNLDQISNAINQQAKNLNPDSRRKNRSQPTRNHKDLRKKRKERKKNRQRQRRKNKGG